MNFRPYTMDNGIYRDVYINDEYGVRTYLLNRDIKYVWDIGGHIGSFSCLINSIYPNAHICVFEPDEENFKLLIKNTQHITNITRYNKAVVTDDNNYYIHTEQYNTGGNIVDDKPEIDNKRIPVQRVIGHLIDNYNLNNINPQDFPSIDLLKLDCEGWEYKILDYIFQNKLTNKIKYICIEFHKNHPQVIGWKTNHNMYIEELKKYYLFVSDKLLINNRKIPC